MTAEEVRFSKAINTGDLVQIKNIASEHLSVLTNVSSLGSGLHYALLVDRTKILSLLINLGADTSAVDSDGQNILTVSAYDSDLKTFKMLFDLGVKVNMTAAITNPLFSAIGSKSTEIASYLVDQGIDISIKYLLGKGTEDEVEMNAYEFAIEQGADDIATLLASEMRNSGLS